MNQGRISTEIKNIRKDRTEIIESKNTITEMKNSIEGFYNRLDEVEESIDEVEGMTVIFLQSEEQKEKRIKNK